MPNQTCSICIFFHRDGAASDDGGSGECRRRCPTPRLTYEGRHCDHDLAVWPRVWGGAWCGEYVGRGPASPQGSAADARTESHA